MVSSLQATKFRSLVGVVQLLRPINLLLSTAGVFVGAYLSVGSTAFSSTHLTSIVLAAISAMAVTAAANAINDAFDVSIDRINRPLRPIPSGKVTARAATLTWLIGALIGIGVSLLLSVEHVLIASASIMLVYLYSAVLKRAGLVGNIVVSGVVAMSLVYGGLATGTIGKAWIGFFLAFLLTLAREIAKDLEDLEGDRQDGVNSLPIAIGHTNTRRFGVALVLVTVIVSPLPFLFSGFDRLYLLGIAATDLLLLAAMWQLWTGAETKATYSLTSTLLKLAMLGGLASLLLA